MNRNETVKTCSECGSLDVTVGHFPGDSECGDCGSVGTPRRINLINAIESTVSCILEQDAIDLWWNLEIPAFYNRTPKQMVEAGQGKTVLAYARTYLDPSFG